MFTFVDFAANGEYRLWVCVSACLCVENICIWEVKNNV